MRPSARLALTGLVGIAMSGWAIQADATTVLNILGGSTSYSFTGTGAGGTPPDAIMVSTGVFSGSATDSTNAGTGTYTLGALSATSGTGVAGVFTLPAAATETFSYTAADGDSLSGTLSNIFFTDGTNTPRMNATATYTVSAGSDAAFQAAFGTAGMLRTAANFDLVVDLIPDTATLDAVAAVAGGSATSTMSSGELVPSPIPGTLPFLATGLVGLWGLSRKRKARRGRLDSALAE